MFGSDLGVSCGPVLEQVSVGVVELFPFGSHVGGSVCEVVFRPEVVSVVSVVDCSNVVEKSFERFSDAVLVEEGWESLVEFMESLDAGEDVVRLLQAASEFVGHGRILKSRVENGSMLGDELLYAIFGENLYVELCPFLLVEGSHDVAEEF